MKEMFKCNQLYFKKQNIVSEMEYVLFRVIYKHAQNYYKSPLIKMK